MSSITEYPGNYFANFLAMLLENYKDKRGNADLSEENVNDFLLFYIHIEGEAEFKNLKQEVEKILTDKKISLFKNKTWNDLQVLNSVAEIVVKKK